MKKILYLMLTVTLIIAALGIAKISALYRQSFTNIEGTNTPLTLALAVRSTPRGDDAAKDIVKPKTADDTFLSKLPCFNCHRMEAWEGIDAPGAFPHSFHISLDMHCLDCHVFVAHGEGMQVAQEACGNCH